MVSMDRRGYHGLSPFGSVFGHWCRISSLRSLPHHFKITKCHQSILVQVVPDDAHTRSFQTIMSLTVDSIIWHPANMPKLLELPHSDCIHHCFISLYNYSYLFFDLAISLPKYVCNTSSQMQVVFFHPLYLQSMFLLRRLALEKLLSLEVEA